MKRFLILHNIRSTHNVGSIFRTAEACGISKIFLTGYTPTPLDNFGREVKTISKTALGAEKKVIWEYVSSPGRLIKKLKHQQFKIIGVEQSKESVDYKKIKIEEPVAFILGNEVRGISKQLLKQCDVIAEIPMIGEKESLNVSVATGVALFRILNI
ncbi:MAG: TrmH family RNA methyltransferase [Patescibacteria group bacterium]|nr:TrmH family RNA methyltransferase [Patescibacteria group bacterium]